MCDVSLYCGVIDLEVGRYVIPVDLASLNSGFWSKHFCSGMRLSV